MERNTSADEGEFKVVGMRKWIYQTNSPIFKYKYGIIAEQIRNLKDMEECFALNIREISFYIMFSDESEWERTFYCPGDDFAELFKEIKDLVPECEYPLLCF